MTILKAVIPAHMARTNSTQEINSESLEVYGAYNWSPWITPFEISRTLTYQLAERGGGIDDAVHCVGFTGARRKANDSGVWVLQNNSFTTQRQFRQFSSALSRAWRRCERTLNAKGAFSPHLTRSHLIWAELILKAAYPIRSSNRFR